MNYTAAPVLSADDRSAVGVHDRTGLNPEDREALLRHTTKDSLLESGEAQVRPERDLSAAYVTTTR
jgi:hypothetical protein